MFRQTRQCKHCFNNVLNKYSSLQLRQFANYIKEHKPKIKKVPKNISAALDYFDSSYPNVFGSNWSNIRLALLCQQKYAAIINNASPCYQENVEKFRELCTYSVEDMYNENIGEGSYNLTNEMEDSFENNELETISTSKSQRKLSEENNSSSNKPKGRYPKEYKRVPGAGIVTPSVPSADRLILPQEHLTEEAQADFLNDFVPSESIRGLEEVEEETDVFLKYDVSNDLKSSVPINVEEANGVFKWPGILHARVFCSGDVSTLPKPEYQYDLYDHFALNASSLLPVIALGVEAGDKVLDTCAAPGGKSLALLQSCLPGSLVSNDVTKSRVRRIHSLIGQYYPENFRALSHHTITMGDGRDVHKSGGVFDRVLVDVPCLNDRHSLLVDENNIMANRRKTERMVMPEKQADLLMSAIQNVRVGGCVVYSTCTLSPLQNDGVVHLALHRLWDRTNIECKVINYSNAIQPFSFMYNFAKNSGLKYGQLIVPSVLNNYGPLYCSKLIRVK